MQINHIHDFLERYAEDQHTANEHEEFKQWLDKAADAEVEGIADRYRQIAEEKMTLSAPRVQLAAKIEAALDEYATQQPVIKMYNKTWFRVAAAIIMVMTSIAIYYFSLSINKMQFEAAQFTIPAMAPGNDRAILIMGDGSEIALEKEPYKIITEKNGQQIANENGALMYNKDGFDTNIIFHTVKVPRKGQYQLQLSDGTRVWINSESSLKFPTVFTGSTRTVEITGEAYFEVAKNTSQPFHVINNNIDIKVLGTHFNVNSYDNEDSKKVTLLEGAVSVSSATNNVTIKPGQQAQLANNSLTIINNADTEEAIAWKEGRFQFKDTDLRTMMRQITRWYDVDVEYNGNVENRYFTADINRGKNLSAVLKILEMSNIHCKIEGKKLIVTP